METVDDETTAAALNFIDRAHNADTPFFVWWNGTHMHFRTHAKPGSRGQAGRWQSEYRDVMIDRDKNVGELLQKLDDLVIRHRPWSPHEHLARRWHDPIL